MKCYNVCVLLADIYICMYICVYFILNFIFIFVHGSIFQVLFGSFLFWKFKEIPYLCLISCWRNIFPVETQRPMMTFQLFLSSQKMIIYLRERRYIIVNLFTWLSLSQSYEIISLSFGTSTHDYCSYTWQKLLQDMCHNPKGRITLKSSCTPDQLKDVLEIMLLKARIINLNEVLFSFSIFLKWRMEPTVCNVGASYCCE